MVAAAAHAETDLEQRQRAAPALCHPQELEMRSALSIADMLTSGCTSGATWSAAGGGQGMNAIGLARQRSVALTWDLLELRGWVVAPNRSQSFIPRDVHVRGGDWPTRCSAEDEFLGCEPDTRDGS